MNAIVAKMLGEANYHSPEEKEQLSTHSGDARCPGCGPNYQGRAAELDQLGWRQSGWASNARWTNPAGTYEVFDEILDQLPDDEWEYVKAATNARSAEDVALPKPKARTLGDYERERNRRPKSLALSMMASVPSQSHPSSP